MNNLAPLCLVLPFIICLSPAGADTPEKFENQKKVVTANAVSTNTTASPIAATRATTATQAQPPRHPALTEMQKIDYLIQAVKDSGLTFIRNGSEYDSPKAAEHLRQKLNFAIRHYGEDQITADLFINRLASRSSITRRAYLIKLKDGRTVPCGQWLTEKLADLQKASRSEKPPRKGTEPGNHK